MIICNHVAMVLFLHPDFQLDHQSYQSLDHIHALMPQFIDGPCNVHFVFLLDLFKNNINTYECPSSPHSSTARINIQDFTL